MKPLDRGLYELLITSGVEKQILAVRERLVVEQDPLSGAEAANRIAAHLAVAIERAVEGLPEEERSRRGIQVARDVLARLEAEIKGSDFLLDSPTEPPSVLRAILGRNPDGSKAVVEPPLIPLLDTTLLTNAPGEPRVGSQIAAEIASADRIDVLMAFIRFTGVQVLRGALEKYLRNGRPIRIVTTTYTGSTERKALDLLRELGAEVRVSYDTSTTRLHAKAWLFHRETGFSTAYIGSSNLSVSAQVTGLEWNVRVSAMRNRDVVDKVAATFESYWASPEYRPYDAAEFDSRSSQQSDRGPLVFLSPVEVKALPFQDRLLEELAVSRVQGFHRNLLAAATGTGKTIMAALDYARLRDELRRDRLLFVAHRHEILDQSMATFRHVLRQASFGEKWVGGQRPKQFEHVFASIQSLSRIDLEHLDPEQFDIVVIDEFHHAAADSYDRLLQHIKPVELLGLTATPERTDGLPVLHWFGDRIAAELRLWDAIDQQYLTPFCYFGISDGVDLSEVPWRRGVGYDLKELTSVYTGTDAWANRVVKEFDEHVDDREATRALGFCVGIDHAKYMADVFNRAGIPSAAISGNTAEEDRAAALSDLRRGAIKVLFSVDLFNEGLDLPMVNTLLLLRPTDSPTLFLQQLGRGLRRSDRKAVCTVLDFVGNHRKEFRFDRRFRALLGGTRQEVERQVEEGFPYLPTGCHMELDRVASEIALRSIRQSIPSQWKQKVEELRSLLKSGHEPKLSLYLEQSSLELEELYAGGKTWSDLLQEVGVQTHARGPEEIALRRAVGRLLHVDDELRLSVFEAFAIGRLPRQAAELDERNRRLVRMLVAALLDTVVDKRVGLQEGIDLVHAHPQVLSELAELFPLLRKRVSHIHPELGGFPGVPLRVHARYTRREILGAFGVKGGATIQPWQTGVQWLPHAKADLFAFTLDKTEGHFSPTTRYRDFAVSPTLIHWESQSVTRADSETGLRYQQHVNRGTSVILFARLRQSERAFWCLGPAEYVKHVGERPMAVTWRLHHPLPGDLFASFAAAVVA